MKSEKKFKLNNRVVCHATIKNKADCAGTVIHIHPTGFPEIGVEFDEMVYGHSCEGHGLEEHCWYVSPKDLEKLVINKIREI